MRRESRCTRLKITGYATQKTPNVIFLRFCVAQKYGCLIGPFGLSIARKVLSNCSTPILKLPNGDKEQPVSSATAEYGGKC